MNINEQLIQIPTPGKRLVKFCGDRIVFTLTLPQAQDGTAWIRTNIGQAKIIRREIIRQVEQDETPLGRAWFDIPMTRVDGQTFAATLPLWESGHFEAKCFFLPRDAATPIWPPGTNTVLNVDAADNCCANIIYNAFVRQFGPNKAGVKYPDDYDQTLIAQLDHNGYTVIPPSGTFRNLIHELDFILGELGCRVLMLLPIHPTPTTYGRMGRFGSPYAALSFTAVDPALAEFDHHATPLEQFIELVDAVHRRNARVFIDIAINHTGWAANLHESHPQWLVRGPEGKIQVPGAWGVDWEDLTKLDYSHKDLWQYMADVFLTWCNRGVDGFRCDAGYMIPAAAWKYMIARVRDQYPDTVFLLEGLGGKISVTRDLLNTANLNWAYSELFQNYDRAQIERYLPESIDIAASDGITVHFAETHDNQRLASRSQVYARMRTALCALFSDQGAYGFANGVEWYATEKINVHNCPSLNWGASVNQVDRIRRLNQLLKTLPVFQGPTESRMIQENSGNYLALLRRHIPTGQSLLVVVNLDDKNQTTAVWNSSAAGTAGPHFTDLLNEIEVSVSEANGRHSCLLEPGQVLCLTQDERCREVLQKLTAAEPFQLPARVENQRLRAKAFEVAAYYGGTQPMVDADPDHLAQQLKKDPAAFCQSINSISSETRVITWQWPRDLRRQVMLPPGHFLMLQADNAFRARLGDGRQTLAYENSLQKADGSYFVLLAPLQAPEAARRLELKLVVFEANGSRHADASILALAEHANVRVKRVFRGAELLKDNLTFIDTNRRGAMLRIPVSWGKLTSRYDSLLAANIHPEIPEDRWIMFARCRAWLVFQGYSQALNTDCLEAFDVNDDTGGTWRYHIPTGQGEDVLVILGLKMIPGENTVELTLYRRPAAKATGRLEDSRPVQIILRPDIENRNFHQTTKAYLGPENDWPRKITCSPNAFQFIPDADHCLRIQISHGEFIPEPEWQYMVHRAVDADRGLDPDSDLFSPGYFIAALKGDQQVTLTANVLPNPEAAPTENNRRPRQPANPVESDATGWGTPREILTRALDDFVVQRGKLKSVIAGYPWFLDWGRDALIFVRGLIAAAKLDDARMILKQFGRFEQQGTLPNMIHGNDAGNRDTSDAPLWFIRTCGELIKAEAADVFLEEACGGRTIRQILLSIGLSFMTQTPNGIYMDPDTGLIFSPVHFTWMDTDHPAGTPRQGYPIEIQALWYAALQILAAVDREETRARWRQLSATVQSSILDLFWSDNLGFLSDCLHASPGQSAGEAVADDALRPNQLLAITLGAVNDPQICRRILAACEELLVPGGIRSLADRRVDHPIEIVHRNQALNDPLRPYQGIYAGDEDTRRKPAYHNGTAWTWPFPSFCEAWAIGYGSAGRNAALAWLSSGVRLLESGCLGHIPEIMDGNAPHTSRGCDAQAWGASELLRVWLKLTSG